MPVPGARGESRGRWRRRAVRACSRPARQGTARGCRVPTRRRSHRRPARPRRPRARAAGPAGQGSAGRGGAARGRGDPRGSGRGRAARGREGRGREGRGREGHPRHARRRSRAPRHGRRRPVRECPDRGRPAQAGAPPGHPGRQPSAPGRPAEPAPGAGLRNLRRGPGLRKRVPRLGGSRRRRTALCRAALYRTALRRTALYWPVLRRPAHRRLRLRGGPGPAAPSRGRLGRVGLRRSVVVGLVVRHGVVPAVVDEGVTGRRRCGPVPRGLRGHPDLPLRCRCRGRCRRCRRRRRGAHGLRRSRHAVRLGRGVGRAVGVGGRQGEHLARCRLLRGGALVGGGQGTPPTSGRPVLAGRVRLTGLRGQGRGQRLLRGTVAPGTPPGRRGHALRRYGPAQTGVGGGGPATVFAGHDDGALGDPGGRHRPLRDVRVGPRVLRRAPASAPRAAGPLTGAGLCRDRQRRGGDLGGRLLSRRCRGRLRALVRRLGRTPPAPSRGSGRRALGTGTRPGVLGRRARDLALQERVDGRPPRTPSSATGGRFGTRALGAGCRPRLGRRTRVRDGPCPAPDRHLQHVRAAAHPRHLVGLQHTAVRPHDPAHDRLVHRVSPEYGPRTSMRTTSPRCAAATTTVLSR